MSAFPMARNALLEDIELVLSNSKILSLDLFASEIVLTLLLFSSGWKRLGSNYLIHACTGTRMELKCKSYATGPYHMSSLLLHRK
jgi:hypothetical protein